MGTKMAIYLARRAKSNQQGRPKLGRARGPNLGKLLFFCHLQAHTAVEGAAFLRVVAGNIVNYAVAHGR